MRTGFVVLVVLLAVAEGCVQRDPTVSLQPTITCESLPPGWQCDKRPTLEEQAASLQDQAAKKKAEFETMTEDANAAEVARKEREKSAERKAVAENAAQRAKEDRSLDAVPNCLLTFGRYENDIRGSLRPSQKLEFDAQRCSVQHKILKALAAFQSAGRPEAFDRLLDAAERR